MDQQAKQQLQEEFDAILKEKDQMISVLQTQVCIFLHILQIYSQYVQPISDFNYFWNQVAFMKKQLHSDLEGPLSSKEDYFHTSDHIQSTSDPQSNYK